uniref:Uncharacterized protein n=1 Tax=Arundo donax TaxID=35708 RepID=A0A0A9HPH0_ARUDO
MTKHSVGRKIHSVMCYPNIQLMLIGIQYCYCALAHILQLFF